MTNEQFEFYKMLLKERFEIMPVIIANASDAKKDKTGASTSMLSLDYRFIGITKFLVENDISSFRIDLSKSVELRMNLLRRFDAGEPISDSYVTMVNYKRLFDALAAANFLLATELASMMGGRPEAERQHDLPFTRVMGYALKEAVLGTGDSARRELIRLFAGPDEEKDPEEDRDEGLTYADFRGYGVVLDAIAANDGKGVDAGLSMVVEGHIHQAKTGIFRDEDDENLCVWGIGLANLARSRGIPVHFNHELIPQALMI